MQTKTPNDRATPDQDSTDLPKLAAPAQRALAAAGIHRLAQLTRFREEDIKELHGIGPNALKQLRNALRARKLGFSNEKKTGPRK